MEDRIALHQIGDYTLGRMVDLMFGGGACHFLPNNTSPSCRFDDNDVFEMAEDMGWAVLTDVNAFRGLKLHDK